MGGLKTAPFIKTNGEIHEKIFSKNIRISTYTKFEVESEDNPQSLENAILDKLGEK